MFIVGVAEALLQLLLVYQIGYHKQKVPMVLFQQSSVWTKSHLVLILGVTLHL